VRDRNLRRTRLFKRYPRHVELERLRGRMPLLAFILVLVVCIALIGFACACLGDQLAPGPDRMFAPALIVMWSAFTALLLATLVIALMVRAQGRALPADLQRFLF